MSTPGGAVKSMPSTMFQIPVLPAGRHIVLNILSTWGDPYYVGLMGMEVPHITHERGTEGHCFMPFFCLLTDALCLPGVCLVSPPQFFDGTGHPIVIDHPESQVWADPPDINALEDYTDDPRTADKVLDGVNFTCDDLHAWLAPFKRGDNHLLGVDLGRTTSLSMVRIWNYNKSRIHCYRGARYVEMTLDNKVIFKGDVRRAPGATEDVEAACECILFTEDQNVLMMIEKYDKQFRAADSQPSTPMDNGTRACLVTFV